MIDRCTNPKHEFYHLYGARGITICERWKKYDNFRDDMGERPARLTLERIDNAGNYEPGNCKWATGLEQGANVRNNRHVVCFGVKVIMNEANRRLGMSRHYLRAVLDKCGWPEIDVGILPATNTQGFLRKWLKGSCRIEFACLNQIP